MQGRTSGTWFMHMLSLQLILVRIPAKGSLLHVIFLYLPRFPVSWLSHIKVSMPEKKSLVKYAVLHSSKSWVIFKGVHDHGLFFLCPLHLSSPLCLFKGLCRPLRWWGVEFQSCSHIVWFMMETEVVRLSLLSWSFLFIHNHVPVSHLSTQTSKHFEEAVVLIYTVCGKDY